ncbi:MAG: phosphoribosyltransferase family protein, partial [Kineosporiaceae bacterium]
MRVWGTAHARVYADRREAGLALADRLRDEKLEEGVVMGLARGGVVVAAEVARLLGLPLDALAVRKVRHPLQPELGIGAVTPGGGVFVRQDVDLTDAEVDAALDSARSSAEALDHRIHAAARPVTVAGRPCVLVDDGLATGATMVAAARWARSSGASRVLIGVPVGPAATVELLRHEADTVVCVETPAIIFSVGEWYDDFRQVSDAEVATLLADSSRPAIQRPVSIDAYDMALAGDLALPAGAPGIVLFAHGSGSSRHSPRNHSVARCLNEAGMGTLLFDLLTPEEALDREHVFDIPFLAGRLAAATRWLATDADTGGLAIGYFGASTGAAAALWAAADDQSVRAIVSRGGRPDLAGGRLADVRAPTLLIVGGDDKTVLTLNRQAATEMRCPWEL